MPLSVGSQLMIAAAVMFIMMAALWVVQRKTGNAGIVDVGWTAGIGILAVFSAVTSSGYLPRRILMAALAGFWSLRLASYLFFTRVWRQPEEGRYVRLREKWGQQANLRLFFFFQLQALADLLFALPLLIVAQRSGTALDVWDLLGVVVWVIGVGGTWLADRQLTQFKQRPDSRGKTCQEGLWYYSRHPNYFFEWVHWWAYVVMAVGSPFWWATLIVPAVLLFLFFKVTGIPPTEAQALASRTDYREYQRTTSVFVPWFRKKGER
jgi:steroid 5-alpha reductase family enzyme